MTQNWIVAVVVILAASYCVWYVLPTSLRQRMGRIHTSLGPSKPCASCNSCGGCAKGESTARDNSGPLTEQPIRFHPTTKR